jgi:5'-nucleotidase/UDP-sugar diphosphatase
MIGLAADDSVKSSPGTIQITNTLETGLAEAARLREEGADIIVAVAHANIAGGREMYATGEFDLILSGDDHDLRLMYDGRTALVESSEEAEYVTAIDVTAIIEVEGDDRDVDFTLAFRPMSTLGMEGDAEVRPVSTSSTNCSMLSLTSTLGTITAELDSRRATVRTQEATMGNLVADGMRAAVGADIAITNGGGIRADRVYEPGTEITRRDILSELPFGNVNIMIELTGAEVLAALENGSPALKTSAASRRSPA